MSLTKWKTKLTQSFPCRIPIVGAPMAGVSGGLLAAETCRAGALGFIAAGYCQDLQGLEEQIRIFRRQASRVDDNCVDGSASEHLPLCLGFLGFAALSTLQGWERYEYVLKTHQPAVVQFFAPCILRHPESGTTNVELAHHHGAKFLAQVGSIQELQVALDAGVDGIIAQGSEAGGHGLRPGLGSGTLPLVSKVASMTELPVVAAGGIVNGKGVAAALALCDGAVLGTRLWASCESIGKKELQQRLIDTKTPDEVIRTTVFDAIENNFRSTPWPEPYDSVGSIRNQTSDAWHGRPDELSAQFHDQSTLLKEYACAQKECNAKIIQVLSGEGVGEIDAIEPAYDILMKIEEETKQVIKGMLQLVD